MVRLLLSSLALFLLLSCRSTPIHEDRDRTLESTLRASARDAISQKIFPGCSIYVLDGAALKAQVIEGRETFAEDAPAITAQHRFDLGSLTQVVATTSVAMALYDDGKIQLEDPVHRYLPEFTGGGKQHATLAMLLAHCAGLAPELQLWQDAEVHDAASGLARIIEQPLVYEPGTETRYSELGMILLGACLERAGGEPFAQLCRTLVFEPLAMDHTSFGPLPGGMPVVPTTSDDGAPMRGRARNANARALGDICGHAGLFATAADLGHLARCLFAGGRFGLRQVFRNSTVARFTKRAVIVPGSTRALGWDTPSAGSPAGSFVTARSVLQTARSGTSIVIDLQEGIAIIVLSHPGRDEQTDIDDFRRAVSDHTLRALRPSRTR